MRLIVFAALAGIGGIQPSTAQISGRAVPDLASIVPVGIKPDAFCAALLGNALARWKKAPSDDQMNSMVMAKGFYHSLSLFAGSVTADADEVAQKRGLVAAQEAASRLSDLEEMSAITSCIQNAMQRLDRVTALTMDKSSANADSQ